MTTVLIPSNFKKNAFAWIWELTETLPGEPLNIVLFHAIEIPTSITDLLMLPRNVKEENLISAQFTSQCNALTETLENVQGIKSVFFYGCTNAAFRNFLESNKIDVLVMPTDFKHHAISPFSQKPDSFMKKAKLPLISVTPQVQENTWAFAQSA